MTEVTAALWPWLVVLPLGWATLAFVIGPARGGWLAIAGITAQLILAVWLAVQLAAGGKQTMAAGGWSVPLGIAFMVDGLSTFMLLLAQAVTLPIVVYARAYFSADNPQARYFWPLAGLMLAGINALFVSADLFNLYVTLELVGLGAVSLVAAGGGVKQVSAALRYLFATLLGSATYLLGVALVYGAYGTVSLETLALLIGAEVPRLVWLAGGLMLAGLMLKTALFPLHYWLPSAHGSAPAPVSALLSALVVKASFYLILRLWLGSFAPLAATAAWLPALLGAAAILWGSIQAIRAPRIKALVAYSTVAQLGYLFLIFPLLEADATALQAGGLQAFAHGLAKAAMFLAAGALIKATGQDSVASLAGVAGRMPVTLFAFGLAGMTLMGLPPSSGFLAKWLLIAAAFEQGEWAIAAVILAGGLLAAVYVFRVLHWAFLQAPVRAQLYPVPRVLEWIAFLLAAVSVLLGLRVLELTQLLLVGSAA